LQLLYGITKQSGDFGGTSRYFNIDFVGPIALGTAARYNGRANPNLPAVIEGRVYLESASAAFGLSATRGIPNVLITLDGGLTQRTDVTGSYEFRFVKPGPHIVSLTTGTLPAGTIPDASSQSLTIEGGQVAQINFGAGVYGGIGGVITETLAGKDVPVPNVQVLVDNQEHGYTGVDGTYEIGHLDDGVHSIEVDADTLPASLSVAGDQKQQVTVSHGQVATANWKLIGLGSISGQILFTGDGGFGDLEPARNVYVVADPGQHAAITDEQGNYIIDNLQPGAYTLSLDEDTLPDGQVIIQQPDGAINLEGGASVEGVGFKLAPAAKQVVMGFGSGSAAGVNAAFVPDHVPPNGASQLVVTTNEKHPTSVTATSD
jgi:hypothetical protein